MTYTLYSRKDSGGFAVEAALAKAKAQHEVIWLDKAAGETLTPAYGTLNPMRQVPTLVLPDGTAMTESAAMVIHLAGVFPGKGLGPAAGTSAHASFLRWMLFMATNIYEADLRYYYPARYTSDPSGADAVKAAGETHMRKCLAIVEAELDPFVLGKEPSIADVYLAMLCTWAPSLPASPKFTALKHTVAGDPDYGPVWAKHGLIA